MFDIGFSELFIAAIVALLVLGPERLPRAARFTGLWVRRARAQWYSVKSELESELADDDLKKSLARTRDELRDIGTDLQNQGRALQDDLRRESESIEQSVKGSAVPTSAAASASEAEALVHATGTVPGLDDDAMTGVFDLGPPPTSPAPDQEETTVPASTKSPSPVASAPDPADDCDASDPRS